MTIRRGNSIIAGNVADIPSQTGQSGKFLTTNGTAASWADPTSNCVKLTGNQTINGEKTFNEGLLCLKSSATIMKFSCQNTDLTKGTTPSNIKELRIYSTDKNGILGSAYTIGGMNVLYKDDGSIETSIRAFKPEANSSISESISVFYPASGDPYATAPTPAVSATGNRIATAAYVNNKFQVVSALPASPDPDTYYFIPES